MITISFKGFEDVDACLNNFKTIGIRTASKEIVTKITNAGVEMAKQQASTFAVTGKLRDAIYAQIFESSGRIGVVSEANNEALLNEYGPDETLSDLPLGVYLNINSNPALAEWKAIVGYPRYSIMLGTLGRTHWGTPRNMVFEPTFERLVSGNEIDNIIYKQIEIALDRSFGR
jgi:hypothetical protein